MDEKRKLTIDEPIERIVNEIRTCRAEMERLDACVASLKTELQDLLEERGSNWNDDIGYARIISEGERTSYNTSALDELIIQDPLRHGWLKDYRLTTPIASRVQVK